MKNNYSVPNFCQKCGSFMFPRGYVEVCRKCGSVIVDIHKFIDYIIANDSVGEILLTEVADGCNVQDVATEAEGAFPYISFAKVIDYLQEKPERIGELKAKLNKKHLGPLQELVSHVGEALKQGLEGIEVHEYPENGYPSWLVTSDSGKYILSISPFPSSCRFTQEGVVLLTSTDYVTLRKWLKTRRNTPNTEWVIIRENNYFIAPKENRGSEDDLALVSDLDRLLPLIGLTPIRDEEEELQLSRKATVIREIEDILSQKSFILKRYDKVIVARYKQLERNMYIHLASPGDILAEYDVHGIVIKFNQFESFVDSTIKIWRNPPVISSGELNEDVLTHYEWHAKKDEDERHFALSRAEQDLGVGYVKNILTFLSHMWRNNTRIRRDMYEAVQSDLDWFVNEFGNGTKVFYRSETKRLLRREFDSTLASDPELRNWIPSSDRIDRFIVIPY
jgi:hypothetical protein